MAWKLSFEFGNESPFRKFLCIWTFDEKPPNFIATEFKPVHVVRQVQVKIVLFSIRFE